MGHLAQIHGSAVGLQSHFGESSQRKRYRPRRWRQGTSDRAALDPVPTPDIPPILFPPRLEARRAHGARRTGRWSRNPEQCAAWHSCDPLDRNASLAPLCPGFDARSAQHLVAGWTRQSTTGTGKRRIRLPRRHFPSQGVSCRALSMLIRARITCKKQGGPKEDRNWNAYMSDNPESACLMIEGSDRQTRINRPDANLRA